jgi:hypothetical protein
VLSAPAFVPCSLLPAAPLITTALFRPQLSTYATISSSNKALTHKRRPADRETANPSGQIVPPPKARHPDHDAGARDRMLEKLGSDWGGA